MNETDPNGIEQHSPGAKLDADKPRMGLVIQAFGKALKAVGDVGTHGAEKYTDGGWAHVPNGVSRYNDAMLRHIMDEGSEMFDPGSGLLHAAHTAWNALARLELMLRESDSQDDAKHYDQCLHRREFMPDKDWRTT